MARNTQLEQLLNYYRAEIRVSLNPAHNIEQRLIQIQLLQSTQAWLYDEFTWPHLQVKRTVAVQAGQRYYTPPSDMSIERIENVEFRSDGRWLPLCYGIDQADYNAWDSDLDTPSDPVRSWPVRKWAIAEDEDSPATQEIELWPVPDQDGSLTTLEGCIRFTGIRNLRPLVSEQDRADLDDWLIVYHAAAQTLAANGAKDAGLKSQLAGRRLQTVRGNLTKQKSFNMFGTRNRPRSRRLVIRQYRPPVA